MRQARYEIVEDDGAFYGDIPAIPGVWANARTLEACRVELASVLEGWVLVSIADHSPIRTTTESRSALPRRYQHPSAARNSWASGFPTACARARSSIRS
jgi:predicted RNase H-like HicB family nuclease